MLELILVIILARKNGRSAKEKGYKGGWFIFLTIVLWFTGELIGALIAIISSEEMLMIYGKALLGGILGGAATVVIINSLREKNVSPEVDKE